MSRTRATTSTQAAPSTEQDIRMRMLNAFLSCPHRDLEKIKEVHTTLQAQDPLFYAHLAAWYRKNGEIRDHKEMFTAALICDPYLPNREVGLSFYREDAPYMKSRVLGTIKGKSIKIRHKIEGQTVVARKSKKRVQKVRIEKKFVGLFKNPPTSFKKDVIAYLRHLESDVKRFDDVALSNISDLKTLYASLNIKPSKRSDDILFKKNYPKDSKLTVFEKIQNAPTSEEAAKLIVENKIPYTTAVGLVKKVTPSILIALINNMSSQEILNNMASFEEKGAYDNPDVKALIDKKLEKAKTSKNVAALKTKTAQKTGRIKNEEVIAKLDAVTDQQVKNTPITLPTALFVDSSGSMEKCIEAGKGVAALIAGAVQADFYVCTFDSMARPIDIKKGATYTDAERAFAPIHPNGYTSIGVALDYLLRKKAYVEQIVVITDEGENKDPRFSDVYKKYCTEMKVSPNIVLIRIDGPVISRDFSRSLTNNGIEFDLYENPTDYYALPGLLPLLARKSKLDLLYEIMDTPLPSRKPFRT